MENVIALMISGVCFLFMLLVALTETDVFNKYFSWMLVFFFGFILAAVLKEWIYQWIKEDKSEKKEEQVEQIQKFL